MKSLLFPLLLSLSFCSTAYTSSREYDGTPTLRKINAATGDLQWNVKLRRYQMPYRIEAYPGKIVVFYWERYDDYDERDSKVLYLDAKNGRAIAPFDTRDFDHKSEDPQVTRSQYHDGSIHEERTEIELPNRWISYGLGRLRLWNSGTNKIHFFHKFSWDLQWTLTLPEGAYKLDHWQEMLIFRSTVGARSPLAVDMLHGQRAGRKAPDWKFTLPKDIPKRERETGGIGPPAFARDFSYTVGNSDVFIFGNRVLFGLDPSTGKIRWRSALPAESPDRGEVTAPFEEGEVLELGDQLILFSENVLARFNKKTHAISILRKDLSDVSVQMVFDGSIYCFTDK